MITIAQRAHYIAESETACRVNVLKLVSPNQPDLQQLWVRVRVEAWDISKQRIPRSFHLRPFIVLTITKRAHYKAKSEATCRVSVL